MCKSDEVFPFRMPKILNPVHLIHVSVNLKVFVRVLPSPGTDQFRSVLSIEHPAGPINLSVSEPKQTLSQITDSHINLLCSTRTMKILIALFLLKFLLFLNKNFRKKSSLAEKLKSAILAKSVQ